MGGGSGGGVGVSGGSGDGRTAYGSRAIAVGQSMDPDSLKVELWLVHTAPGIAEDRTVYQTLTSTREGAMFAFAPVSVATPEGTVGVQITGSFSIQGALPRIVSSS